MCTDEIYTCKDLSRINCTLACLTLGYLPCKNYIDMKICNNLADEKLYYNMKSNNKFHQLKNTPRTWHEVFFYLCN